MSARYSRSRWHIVAVLIWLVRSASQESAFAETPIDLANYHPDCQVEIQGWNGNLRVAWPIAGELWGHATLDLSGAGPLVQVLGLGGRSGSDVRPILSQVDPVWWITAGERRPPADKPPEHFWEVFFDNPAQRPHETYLSKLQPQTAKVTGRGSRATVAVEGLTIGPFAGAVEITFYAGCGLVRIEGAVSTDKDGLAIFYDAGLVADQPTWRELAWTDTAGRLVRLPADGQPEAAGPLPATSPFPPQAVRVRHRMIAAAGEAGSLACFPPPHQFQFPRDYSTNLAFVWAGRDYHGLAGKSGFGVRQHKDGGGRFVPWFNAPPGIKHRLALFCLLAPGGADEALAEALKLTHGDRFIELPGYQTFTSHYHMAIAVAAMQAQAAGRVRSEPPEWVHAFRELGVNLVHLAEFHGDGHPKDPGPLRLPEMQAMFDECRRWSDERLLFIPGEEGNDFLGLKLAGKHPGHWMSLFPRPVYWTMTRAPEQPFVEEIPPYGRVYHVGDRGDMIRLLKEERGLVWSAHPRIKASSWTPDVFRHEDFFLAEFWLGGAWKAMPGDLSRDKLGERVLNLLDDMANWGQRKYVPGEVDVFTIDRTHELYGHMNINYVALDRVPRFDEGWQPVLDVLRAGRFFVTTGEVLLPRFQVGGKRSGEVVKPGEEPLELTADLRWTFPLAFAEVISGDGQQVYRQRIDLSDTPAFGRRTLKLTPDLAGRNWVRLEVWDVAANGAFTQPVWMER